MEFKARRSRICAAAQRRGVSLGLADVFATDLDALEARLTAQPDRRDWGQRSRKHDHILRSIYTPWGVRGGEPGEESAQAAKEAGRDEDGATTG